MWKPANPMSIEGVVLTDQEAWWYEFKDAFHELCADEIDEEWLERLATALYPIHFDHDPREAAAVAFATLNHEVPGQESEDSSAYPPPRA